MSWKQYLLSKEYNYHKQNGERLYKESALGEARIELEVALEKLQKIKTAEEESLLSLLNTISVNLTEQNLSKARYYWSEGDLENSLNYFQSALGLVKSSTVRDEILIEVSRLKLEMAPVEEISDLEVAVKNEPENVDVLLDLALEYGLSGYYDRAIHELRKLQTLCPNHEEGLLRLGNAYFDSGQYHNAIESYQLGIQLGGELSSQFLYRRAHIAFFAQEYTNCLSFLQESLDLDPSHSDALVLQGRAYGRVDEKENAIDSYEKALSLDSDDTQIMMKIAGLWEDLGYIKNSRDIWREVIELKSNDIYSESAAEKLRFYESVI
ncbi:MAG: tetratricopeptide repeat protein [Candidatus Cloacimonetes bacterium]|nr:tetratricopeptide repeat protein [Candidatus Cloacimonadota bacterium]